MILSDKKRDIEISIKIYGGTSPTDLSALRTSCVKRTNRLYVGMQRSWISLKLTVYEFLRVKS